jgi:(p)ppGpp synthase/HD superfamily hydrolase
MNPLHPPSVPTDRADASSAADGTGSFSPDGDLLARARVLAHRAHDGQTRDDGRPYITHPEAVARILADEMLVTDVRLLAAALLHDVIEDTPVTAAELEAEVGVAVTRWVVSLTKQPPGKPRDVRITEDLDRVVIAGIEAVTVKIADRLHNLRSIRGKNDPARRRRFLDETRRHFVPFVERSRPDLLDLFLADLERAESHEAGRAAPELASTLEAPQPPASTSS